MKVVSKLFLVKILTILFFCFVYFMNGFTQNKRYVEIDFIKEIKQGDTCIRFFNVKNFNNKSKNNWFTFLEYIHNVVLILPNNDDWEEIDEEIKNDVYYTSSCENVIFYCIDGNEDSNLLTIDNVLNNEKLRRKIICMRYYNMPKSVIIDPFNYGIYKNISY